MKIYSCYTPSHEILFRDYFLPSLPESLESHSTQLEIAGTGDFLTDEFLRTIEAKLELILASIDANSGSAIVWSDVDIVFLGDPAARIATLLNSRPDVDLWFQRETTGRKSDVNAGFVLMRCVKAVSDLYRKTLIEMRMVPGSNEQAIINRHLRTPNPVSWDYLPVEFYARSHGWPPKGNIVLYHANCTAGADGIGQKLRQFADLRRFKTYGRPYLKLMQWRDSLKKRRQKANGIFF